MTKDIKTERRWLRSVIAASAEPLPEFPWMRSQRRRPAAFQTEETAAPVTEATRKVVLFGRNGSIAAH